MIITYMKEEIPGEESSKTRRGYYPYRPSEYKQQDSKTISSNLYYKTGAPL